MSTDPTIVRHLAERARAQEDHLLADTLCDFAALLDQLSAPPQIIRTVEELEALDPETEVWPARRHGPYAAGALAPDPRFPHHTPPLPAVVVATGSQVRDARKALEEA